MTEFIYKNNRIRYGKAIEKFDKLGIHIYSAVCYDCREVLANHTIYPDSHIDRHEKEKHKGA